ncbi:MAG: hypothetical protein V1724_03195 [Chloroflexota bacterium]
MNTNPSTPLRTGVLYWGDNLPILRNKDYFPDESVDLVYLDPPFNSNASYNVLFKEATGAPSTAQAEAFKDTWHWADAQDTWAGPSQHSPQASGGRPGGIPEDHRPPRRPVCP